LALVVSPVFTVKADLVNLIAYVSYSLLNNLGLPLADGTIVMIIGSGDAVANPMVYVGGNPIAWSVTGDDVIIGEIRIGQPSYNGSNGTFLTDSQFQYDSSVVSNMYIRFFNTTNAVPTGSVVWGYTTPIPVTNQFGDATVDFVGNYMTTLTNFFVVIPEPSTSRLYLLFFGVLAGLYASMRKPRTDVKVLAREVPTQSSD